jgi:hypothetical protein
MAKKWETLPGHGIQTAKQTQAMQHPSLSNGFLAYNQGRGVEIQN